MREEDKLQREINKKYDNIDHILDKKYNEKWQRQNAEPGKKLSREYNSKGDQWREAERQRSPQLYRKYSQI